MSGNGDSENFALRRDVCHKCGKPFPEDEIPLSTFNQCISIWNLCEGCYDSLPERWKMPCMDCLANGFCAYPYATKK